MRDSLGDRMKMFESLSEDKLLPRMPVLGRLDGKAFHTFTRKMQRPYDERFHQCMWETGKALCRNIQGCQVVYVQSDEINLLLTDWARFNTSSWFIYRVQKMCSIAASIATVEFTKAYINKFETDINDMQILPAFDARFWNIPRHEVANNFIWRQADAVRNSIQSAGQAYFNHKKLHKKSCADVKEMLLDIGVDWEKYPIAQKRGVCISKVRKEDGRSNWEVDLSIPIFSQNKEYIDKHLPHLFWKEYID